MPEVEDEKGDGEPADDEADGDVSGDTAASCFNPDLYKTGTIFNTVENLENYFDGALVLVR